MTVVTARSLGVVGDERQQWVHAATLPLLGLYGEAQAANEIACGAVQVAIACDAPLQGRRPGLHAGPTALGIANVFKQQQGAVGFQHPCDLAEPLGGVID